MQLCFPHSELRTENQNGQEMVWDPLRKKWLVHQPEEWVRQQLIQFLLRHKNISPALIGIEKEITYRGQRKRFDLIVFDTNGKAFILIECKAPEVPLSQDTLHQIARYNQSIQAPHLLLTNGKQLLFFSQNEKGSYQHQPSGWYT